MGQLIKAENIYPIRSNIGEDTVICSTPEQQKTYLNWYIQREECREENTLLKEKIGTLDSIIIALKQDKKDLQSNAFDFQKVNANMQKLNDISNDKFDKLEKTYDKQSRKIKVKSVAFGVSFGFISITTLATLTYLVFNK